MIFDSAMLAAIAAEMAPLLGARLRDVWLSDSAHVDSTHVDSARDMNAPADAAHTHAQGSRPQGSRPQGSRAFFLAWPAATLLIDTDPQRARLHFVGQGRAAGHRSGAHRSGEHREPAAPPTPFLEAARKALRGATLLAIEQPQFDRVLRLTFAARDAIGSVQRCTLIAEIMDRRSNIILLDAAGIIIDAQKRLPPFLNRARTILPHRPYLPPPGSDKANPLLVQDWAAWVAQASTAQAATAAEPALPQLELGYPELLTAALRNSFNGISPLTARYLQSALGRGLAPAAACAEYFESVRAAVSGHCTPVPCSGSPYPFALEANCTAAGGTLSELLARANELAAAQQQWHSARSALLAHLARREKRLAGQRQDVEKALRYGAEAQNHKTHGQLLLANLAAVEAAARRGQSWVELGAQWGQAETVRIAIEPKWPAAANAERCFARYKRAQKLAAGAPARLGELEAEAAQLALWRRRAEAAIDSQQLELVGVEAAQNLAPAKIRSRSAQQQQAARPENKLRHRDVEGWTVYMGRSALENQLLLSKIAAPSDIWMHLRGMASAHVLVKAQKGKTPPPQVLQEAGRWVATAGKSGKLLAGERLEIIYTPAKWVRAVKGAPGRVTLQRFETLEVKV